MISKIQKSWCQFCDITITGSFQTGLETTICRLLQGPSQLSMPLYSQLILRIYAAMNGVVHSPANSTKHYLQKARL